MYPGGEKVGFEKTLDLILGRDSQRTIDNFPEITSRFNPEINSQIESLAPTNKIIDELHPILILALAGDCPFCSLFKQTTKEKLLQSLKLRYPNLRYLTIDAITRRIDSVEIAIREAGWADPSTVNQLARSIPHWPALILVSPGSKWSYQVYGKIFSNDGTLVPDPQHRPILVINQNVTLEQVVQSIVAWLEQQLPLPEFRSIRLVANSPTFLQGQDFPDGSINEFLELLSGTGSSEEPGRISPNHNYTDPPDKPVYRFRVGRPEKFL